VGFLGDALETLGGQFCPGLIVPEAGKLALDGVGPLSLGFVIVIEASLALIEISSGMS
jgi:hypothetical protein